MGEQLSEISVLRRSVHEMQRDFAEIVRIADRTFIGLQELSGVGLHFRQMKREQFRLSEKLKMISSAMDTLEGAAAASGRDPEMAGREYQGNRRCLRSHT